MDEAEPGLADLLLATAQELRVTPPDLSSPFLDHLISLSLEDLLVQPSDIANELASVQSELVNLCFREYSTFISVHKCSAAVQSAFDDFDGSLTRLIQSAPDLEDASRSFSTKTSDIQASRSNINLVRDHQDKLLDLLEIPQLMDTCVRNGFYQEAIELAAQMTALRGRHRTVPIVQDVYKESEQVLQAMLAQLLSLLKEPVKLPALMKSIGYLRRLGYLEEDDLALVFLASRSLFLQTQLQQLERDKADPVRYLRRYIDIFREHVYDIISQASAIFDKPDLIIAFASQCVDGLITLVRGTVKLFASDSASLSSILVQLAYCATSFARVGFDFSPLIVQPFLQVVSTSFEQLLSAATSDLFNLLRSASRNATIPSSFVSSGVSSPSRLADFPPIALFANAHYSALNALRLLAPTELYPRLAQLQTKYLAEATTAVCDYVREAERSWDDQETSSVASPRAHLLRRSTETLWTPAMRASRRKDSINVLVAFADVWRTELIPALITGLSQMVFNGGDYSDSRLDSQLETLADWCDTRREQTEEIPVGGPTVNDVRPNGTTDAVALSNGSDHPRTPGENHIASVHNETANEVPIQTVDAVEVGAISAAPAVSSLPPAGTGPSTFVDDDRDDSNRIDDSPSALDGAIAPTAASPTEELVPTPADPPDVKPVAATPEIISPHDSIADGAMAPPEEPRTTPADAPNVEPEAATPEVLPPSEDPSSGIASPGSPPTPEVPAGPSDVDELAAKVENTDQSVTEPPSEADAVETPNEPKGQPKKKKKRKGQR